MKLLGDGVMLHFPGPGRGVLCGLELVDRIPELGLPRARVGDYARPEEVLVSEAVAAAAGGQPGVRYEPVGPVSLKGLAGPIALFAATRAAGLATEPPANAG